jgi:hypothetical protein
MGQTWYMTDHGLVQLTLGDLPTGVPVPPIPSVGLTSQAANVGATTLWAVPVTGYFRIQLSIKRTQIATTSSTLPSVTITWSDGDNSAAATTTPIATNATNTLVGAVSSEITIYAKAGTNIQYSTTGYVSSGATPMQYALRIRIEAL